MRQSANAENREQGAGTGFVPGASRAYAAGPTGSGRVVTPSAWVRREPAESEALLRLRDEVRGLRQRLGGAEQERAAMESAYLARIQGLETRVQALGRELDLAQQSPARVAPPPAEILSKPLVIRSDQGEYLGVLGKERKHFTLRDFVALMEQNAGPELGITVAWEKKAEHWVLLVGARDSASDQEQKLVLVVREMVTPNNNPVVLILRFNIDGRDVSEALLLGLFKQIRSGLDV